VIGAPVCPKCGREADGVMESQINGKHRRDCFCRSCWIWFDSDPLTVPSVGVAPPAKVVKKPRRR